MIKTVKKLKGYLNKSQRKLVKQIIKDVDKFRFLPNIVDRVIDYLEKLK